jgi:hypothetical protein
MNPLLRTLLESEEVRLVKREITKKIGNDIYRNSIRRVYRGGDEKKTTQPYLTLDDDRKLLSPSERLLKMVAVIVHKANISEKKQARFRQRQKRKNLRKKALEKNPLGIVTVQRPRQRIVDHILGINRMKRSIVKFTSDLVEMKSLLDKVNQSEELEDENQEKILNKSDSDDYYYDYDDYQMPSDGDYDFNNFGLNNKNYYDDYENGSVNEFIHLAKQRDRREKSGQTESFESSYEYEDEES